MFITFLIYGIIHRIRTQALAKKRRPKKVLIEDQFSSIIKTNAQELLRPSSVLIILQKNDKIEHVFVNPIFHSPTKAMTAVNIELSVN